MLNAVRVDSSHMLEGQLHYLVRAGDLGQQDVASGLTIVVPSVAAPGLLVLRERIKSEMESARVVVGWGKDEIKCMSVFREKINFILPSEKKIIAPLVLKPRKQKLFSLLIILSKRKLKW